MDGGCCLYQSRPSGTGTVWGLEFSGIRYAGSINASRIAHRVMKGGHDVPITKIISRYSKSILNCKRCVILVDRAYIYDNSVDGADARLLFRLTDGSLFKVYSDNIPEWALTILK